MRAIHGQLAMFQANGGAAPPPPNEYSDRLLKLVPAESITAYVAINGIVSGFPGFSAPIDWAAFAVVLVGTPFWLRRNEPQMSWRQALVSVVAFSVFVMAMGAVFARHIPNYTTVYGAVFTPCVVFLAPLLGNEFFEKQ